MESIFLFALVAGMTWIKLDDKAPRHPKISELSDRSFRWWILSLCYASEFLTDGVLPKAFFANVPKQVRAELTSAGLWEFTDPNLQIHDYLEHQTSKTSVERERQRNRDRRKGDRREDERRTAGTTAGTTAGSTAEKPRPEGREQIQNTERREQMGAPSARPTLIARGDSVRFFRLHGQHVDGFCDWVCLAQEQVDEFAKKIPGDDLQLKRDQIRDWALTVRAQWADRIVGDGSHFEFWRNRWTETHGGSRPANATLKAARAAADLDEAFR